MLYYLVGIKGAGMSSLAKILIYDGNIVSGVDENEDFYTTKDLNITIDNFSNMSLNKNYFYIIGNAYINHSVTKYLKLKKYYLMTYPNFINYYFKNKRMICISGSHGKTFTTSLLAHIYGDAYALVGDGFGRSGKDSLILESCEYKDTFLNYNPDISLILNVDYDHPDYFKNEDMYRESFVKFQEKSKICILNNDDYNAMAFNRHNVISYGLNNADITFNYKLEKDKTIINVLNNTFILNYPGEHFAYNFTGAYIILKLLGFSDELIKEKLKTFKMPTRRFEINNINDINFILDYAHHPTEIIAIYESINVKFKGKKKVLFFEPHTLSRSLVLKDKFKKSFNLFDEVYLLDIFTSVRESKDLIKQDKLYEYFNYNKVKQIDILNYKFTNDYIYIFLGAGNIDKLYRKLLNKIKNIN